MASSCVKNVGTSPSHTWTTSSKMSITTTRESQQPLDNEEDDDFEFLLDNPVTMLSADELFSDGKLVPLKFSGVTNSEDNKPTTTTTTSVAVKPNRSVEMVDPYLFSPRAPRCTVRWRELLGLKKVKAQDETSSSRLSSSSPNPKTASFRHFLNRTSKSTTTQPPEKDSEISETLTSISSSRLSLSSSSSSGHELDEVPRLSLDLDNNNKPGTPNPFARSRAHHQHLRKPRHHHSRAADESSTESSVDTRAMTVTADSPRLNASGKIVFHGLERSSSSPGNFTGGPRLKLHHGMPRSHSANVRITPVLNVPVSSLRSGPKSGLSFGQLFASSSQPGNNRAQSQSKTRTNRTGG